MDQPDGVAFKTTRDVTINSSLGRTLLQATEVYDGNALAGLNAKIGKTSYEQFQRIAGALHQGEGLSGLIMAYFGKEYGPPPTYGEEILQYRMSVIGYNELYDSYETWKSKQ